MKPPGANTAILSDHPKVVGANRALLGTFTLAAGIGALALIAISAALLSFAPEKMIWVGVGVIVYLLAAALAGLRLKQTYEHATLGLCNIATMTRLVIVAVLFVVMISGTAPNRATFGIAAFALALDGVDGWLARKQGLASDFGAQFDVEVDATFALVLAIYAGTNGAAGIWVILLGLPHYLFWIARLKFPWLNNSLRPSFARKAVCVFQIGTLIALQVPLLANGQLNPVIGAVTLALLWSFGRDILWLWRTKA